MKKYLSLIIGILGIAALILFSDYRAVLRAMQEMQISYLLLGFCVFFFSLLLRGTRWNAITLDTKDTKALYFICFLGNAMNRILPSKLGGLVKAYLYAQREKKPLAEGFASVFLDNILELSFVLVSCVIIFLIWPFQMMIKNATLIAMGIFIIAVIAIVMSIFFLQSPWFMKISSKINKIRKLQEKYGTGFKDAFKKYFSSLKIKRIVIGYLLTLLVWCIVALANYLVLLGLGRSISFMMIYVVATLPVVLGIMSLLPGGYGVQEVSTVALLVAAGIPLEIATSFSLIMRAIDLVLVMITGYLGMCALSIKSWHHLEEKVA